MEKKRWVLVGGGLLMGGLLRGNFDDKDPMPKRYRGRSHTEYPFLFLLGLLNFGTTLRAAFRFSIYPSDPIISSIKLSGSPYLRLTAWSRSYVAEASAVSQGSARVARSSAKAAKLKLSSGGNEIAIRAFQLDCL